MQDKAISEITPEMLEQNPVLLFMLLIVTLVFILGGLASLASWGWIAYRIAGGSAVLPLTTPWRPRFWSLLDVVIIMAMVIALQAVLIGSAMQYLGSSQSDSPSLGVMAVDGLAKIVGVFLGIAWIEYRYRQGRGHIGFGPIDLKTLLAALVLGIASIPIVYLLMMVISKISATEYEHPLINSATESGTLPSYLLGCFAAVIAAPIAEEFLFRVVLQGWLQSIPFKRLMDSIIGTTNVSVMRGTRFDQDEETTDESIQVPPSTETGSAVVSGEHSSSEAAMQLGIPSEPVFGNPYAPTVTNEELASLTDSPINTLAEEIEQYRTPRIPPLWPSIVAGVLFGLAHFDYGWSCIPLSFLGIVLGLIYRKTHSVWPCIVIHALLNSLAMLMLGLMILMQQAAGGN